MSFCSKTSSSSHFTQSKSWYIDKGLKNPQEWHTLPLWLSYHSPSFVWLHPHSFPCCYWNMPDNLSSWPFCIWFSLSWNTFFPDTHNANLTTFFNSFLSNAFSIRLNWPPPELLIILTLGYLFFLIAYITILLAMWLHLFSLATT